MKRLFRTAALAAALFAIVPAVYAQDFNKGVSASQAGDYAAALVEWRPLADQGDAEAQYNLGVMYGNGFGVLQDYSEAVRWYRLAADQGAAEAQGNLGYMYLNGFGVLHDNIFAHMWFNIGSANGNENSRHNLDIVAKKMTRAEIAEATERARTCMASNYTDCG